MQRFAIEVSTTQDSVLLTDGTRRQHSGILKVFLHLVQPDFDNQDCLGQCCTASSDITLYGYITLYNDTTLSWSVTGL